MELTDSINGQSFGDWLASVKTIMLEHPDVYSSSDIKSVDFELEYWGEYFTDNLSPNEAILQDLNAE